MHEHSFSLHSRREVLKKAGLALLASSSLLPALSEGQSTAVRSKRIIIAGGGIGGLCCAFELMERGHEVTVLEASRRTGGHVKTLREGLPDGLYADVGAEHFTNPGYTQYRKYVEKFDLPYGDMPKGGVKIFEFQPTMNSLEDDGRGRDVLDIWLVQSRCPFLAD